MTDIALVCDRNGYWFQAATHLLISLRLPQIGVYLDGEILPDSVHTVISIGPPNWISKTDGVDNWLLTTATRENHYQTRQLISYTHYNPSVEDSDGRLGEQLFWSKERLIKGAGVLSCADILSWLVLLKLFNIAFGREDELAEVVLRVLLERSPEEFLKKTSDLLHAVNEPQPRWFELLEKTIDQLGEKLLLSSGTTEPNSSFPDRKTMLRLPILMVWYALRIKGKSGQAEYVSKLESVLPYANNALRLLALGTAAKWLGMGSLDGKVDDELGNREWSAPRTSLLRMSPNSKALCYSPLASIWRSLRSSDAQGESTLREFVGSLVQHERLLRWSLFDKPSTSCSWSLPDVGNLLLDGKCRHISRSLLNNWLLLHTAPCPLGRKYRLTRANYDQIISSVESMWISVFNTIQGSKDCPLIRLKSWPENYVGAMSIRYDVDRSVSDERMREVCDLQRRLFSRSCGTWYYFPDDPERLTQSALLNNMEQEIGLHLVEGGQAEAGIGITHHSSPTSEYWRGDGSTLMLYEARSQYGEFLCLQLPTCRPLWHTQLMGCSDVRSVEIPWLIPLNFPLEGSTSDESLEYFDKRLEEFRRQIDEGGHAIIATHPDLNQELLARLAAREDLDNVWFASTEEVLRRYIQIATPGHFTCTTLSSSRVVLSSWVDVESIGFEIFSTQGVQRNVESIGVTSGETYSIDI